MEGLLYDSHVLSLTGWSETETEGGEVEGVGTDGGVSWGTKTVVENLSVTEFEGLRRITCMDLLVTQWLGRNLMKQWCL